MDRTKEQIAEEMEAFKQYRPYVCSALAFIYYCVQSKGRGTGLDTKLVSDSYSVASEFLSGLANDIEGIGDFGE